MSNKAIIKDKPIIENLDQKKNKEAPVEVKVDGTLIENVKVKRVYQKKTKEVLLTPVEVKVEETPVEYVKVKRVYQKKTKEVLPTPVEVKVEETPVEDVKRVYQKKTKEVLPNPVEVKVEETPVEDVKVKRLYQKKTKEVLPTPVEVKVEDVKVKRVYQQKNKEVLPTPVEVKVDETSIEDVKVKRVYQQKNKEVLPTPVEVKVDETSIEDVKVKRVYKKKTKKELPVEVKTTKILQNSEKKVNIRRPYTKKVKTEDFSSSSKKSNSTSSKKPGASKSKRVSNILWPYNCHSTPPLIHSSHFDPSSDTLIGIFVDPGKINCGVRICSNNLITGKITTIMQRSFNFMDKDIEKIEGDDVTTVHYSNMLKLFEEFIPLFQNSHYIVIERQLRQNYSMIRFSQHLITYFMYVTKNKGLKPLIYEMDSSLKTRFLNAPPFGKNKKARKNWNIQKAMEILEEREDLECLKLLKSLKTTGTNKADEAADTVSMCEVFWNMLKSGEHGIPSPIPL
jgi:hypothetical protein